MRLILASSSRYRHEMLSRLGIPFEAVSPNVDETPLPGEPPAELSIRLSRAKAEAICALHRGAVVIGSDQVATFDGHPIGKPGNFERARDQLRMLSGRTVEFHSALCVHDGKRYEIEDVITRCEFLVLSDAQIDMYLQREKPFDTAGSAKAEGLGIALMRAVHTDDPTAIIGLPLIALSRMLRSFDIDPITHGT